jgi:hypothetical protein
MFFTLLHLGLDLYSFSIYTMSSYLIALCIALQLAGSFAWGPITHLYFACEGLSSDVTSCLNSATYLFWGGLMPDGLTMDPYMEGNNCSFLVHDAEFSGKKGS